MAPGERHNGMRTEGSGPWADIALVQTPFFSPDLPPPWMGALLGWLREEGLRCVALDLNIATYRGADPALERLWTHALAEPLDEAAIMERFGEVIASQADALLAVPASVLGFHASHNTTPWVRLLVRFLREGGDRRPIVLGGPGTRLPAEWPSIPWELVDYLVVGDGERTLTRLLHHLQAGLPINRLPGLGSAPGTPERYRPRPPIRDLDGLPYASFEGLPLASYRSACLPCVTSRSCRFRCVFCGDQPAWGPRRSRSANRVLDEIEHQLASSHWDSILFCDLLLDHDAEWWTSFSDGCRQRQLNLPWRASWLPLPADDANDILAKLAATGCTDLDLFLPAVGRGPLDSCDWPGDPDLLERMLRKAAKAGIRNHLHLMVGLPDEGTRDFEATCSWLERNRDHVHELASAELCAVQPLSRVERQPQLHGVTLSEGNHYHQWTAPSSRSFEERRARLEALFNLALSCGIVVNTERASALSSALLIEQLERRERGVQGLDREERHEQYRTLRSAGYLKGEALCGPQVLEIELCNLCNLDCVGCWCHSPLLGEDRMGAQESQRTIPLVRVLQIVDQAFELGVERIQISGAGEPTLHPGFEPIVRHIKSRGIHLTIVTNFTRVDERLADLLVELKVDVITASIWAGTAADYLAVHPAQNEGRFERIEHMLGYLQARRRASGSPSPLVRLFHVICSRNAHGLAAATDLALRTGSQAVEFTPIDLAHPSLAELALGPEEVHEIRAGFGTIRERLDYPFELGTDHLAYQDFPELVGELAEFGRMMHALPEGFAWEEGTLRIRCPNGMQGNIENCDEEQHHVVYRFPPECHEGCNQRNGCPVPGDEHRMAVGYMAVMGAGSFLRRVSGSGEMRPFDANIVDRVPCTVGWNYARVRVDGTLIPCCKGEKLPMGNLIDEGLGPIWLGERMSVFRKMTRSSSKSDPYFEHIGCQRGCDNLGMNMHFLHELMQEPGAAEIEEGSEE